MLRLGKPNQLRMGDQDATPVLSGSNFLAGYVVVERPATHAELLAANFLQYRSRVGDSLGLRSSSSTDIGPFEVERFCLGSMVKQPEVANCRLVQMDHI